jgi:hypothetical protein
LIPELKADKDYQHKSYELALKNVFLKIDRMLLTDIAKVELKKYSKPGQLTGG